MTFAPITAALLTVLQAPASGGGLLSPIVFEFGLIFLIFYFLIIRPQQKQRKTHEEALRTIKRGDRIVTAGGIVAEVIHIKDSVTDGKPKPAMTDEVTIKSGETRLIVERGRIAKIVTAAGSTSSAPVKRDDAG